MADYNPFARIDNLDDGSSSPGGGGGGGVDAPGTPPGPPPPPERKPQSEITTLPSGVPAPPPRASSSTAAGKGKGSSKAKKGAAGSESFVSGAAPSTPKVRRSTTQSSEATMTDDDNEKDESNDDDQQEGGAASRFSGLSLSSGGDPPASPADKLLARTKSAHANLTGEFWEDHFAWTEKVLGSALTVSVKDPVQAARSFMNPNPPIKYLVVTEPLGYAVRRRYSDFLWLRNTLAARFVGICIPPLPEKKMVGNKADQFIKSRMRALGLFVERLVLNAYLKNDVSTMAFLSENDPSTWDKVKKGSAGNTGTGVEMENESEERWKAAITSYNMPGNADRLVADIRMQINSLEAVMRSLVSSSYRMMNSSYAYTGALHDFNVSYRQVVRLETTGSDEKRVEYVNKSGADLLEVLDGMGRCFTSWAQVATFHPHILEQLLYEVLKYELANITEMRKLLDGLDAMRGAHERALGLLQRHEQEKVGYEQRGRPDRAVKMDDKIRADKEQVEQSRYVVDFMTKGLFFAEIDRFASNKVCSFSEMAGKLAAAQIKYITKLGKMWGATIEHLGLNKNEMNEKARVSLEAIETSTRQV